MFKEERLLLKLSIFLILILSTTLYFGQVETIFKTLTFFGLTSEPAIKFVENLLLIENAFLPEKINIIIGINGYIIAFIIFIINRLLVKPKRKKVIFSGITLLILGFLEMILLDISVVGWLAGPIIMISGFLIYKKSFYFM